MSGNRAWNQSPQGVANVLERVPSKAQWSIAIVPVVRTMVMGESQVEVIRPAPGNVIILWGYDSKRTKAARLDIDLVGILGSSVADTIGGGCANHPVAQVRPSPGDFCRS